MRGRKKAAFYETNRFKVRKQTTKRRFNTPSQKTKQNPKTTKTTQYQPTHQLQDKTTLATKHANVARPNCHTKNYQIEPETKPWACSLGYVPTWIIANKRLAP